MRSYRRSDPLGIDPPREVECASDEAVQAAVARARSAAPEWAEQTLSARLRTLGRLERLIIDQIEDVVQAISADTGKPRVEALMTEGVPVPLFMNWFRKHAEGVLAPKRLRTPLEFAPRQAWVEHFPMGVVAVISPWNFPFQLSLTPALSALVAGNTVVLKPSEVTPRVGDLLADLVRRADLGDGVFEVVRGDGLTGSALCASDVDKIFFTGSLATGRKVMAQAASRPIPVELELGGKDAFLVMDDAPLERAARAAVWGAFMNAGQMCVSVERVFVHASVHDAFCSRVKELMSGITMGPPSSESDMGPLTYERQLEVFRRHVEQAGEAGATVHSSGAAPLGGGWYVAPTLVTGVEPGMAIYDEESFSPVLPVLKFETLDEAIDMINGHTYGLNASVWTSSISRGRTIASRIRAGQVHINDVVSPVGNPSLPFGGVGGSGFGRYHGEDGLLAFVNRRGVSASPSWWPAEPFWFPYRGKYPAARQLFDQLARGSVTGATNALIQMARIHRRSTG